MLVKDLFTNKSIIGEFTMQNKKKKQFNCTSHVPPTSVTNIGTFQRNFVCVTFEKCPITFSSKQANEKHVEFPLSFY